MPGVERVNFSRHYKSVAVNEFCGEMLRTLSGNCKNLLLLNLPLVMALHITGLLKDQYPESSDSVVKSLAKIQPVN